ncbi:hypothetical protein CAOG_01642 [Capsaspora owczarzaki ATCC 30864]|uniref:Uncharacterized protein n=1 Tax=Capsaspora owczarzaki (strain ATCC 30864) TaxID=595528 RepID=A0A0D2VJX6_CAPO3|nr:hypothetical protein CAOG_01642 [Capsaspora owczarzaki ATCC 30864]KJE90312.1 hypothetical protein CAOG_001642 [Capsaspora owczarzaki ATCC 30864]|eukprot:XP_004364510.1 hypothetical protein CAOG_01642 [Capsaspora owczarzaki ATCC 30864]
MLGRLVLRSTALPVQARLTHRHHHQHQHHPSFIHHPSPPSAPSRRSFLSSAQADRPSSRPPVAAAGPAGSAAAKTLTAELEAPSSRQALRPTLADAHVKRSQPRVPPTASSSTSSSAAAVAAAASARKRASAQVPSIPLKPTPRDALTGSTTLNPADQSGSDSATSTLRSTIGNAPPDSDQHPKAYHLDKLRASPKRNERAIDKEVEAVHAAMALDSPLVSAMLQQDDARLAALLSEADLDAWRSKCDASQHVPGSTSLLDAIGAKCYPLARTILDALPKSGEAARQTVVQRYLNVTNYKNQSALRLAVSRGEVELASALFGAGAQAIPHQTTFVTLLMEAVWRNDKPMIELLLKRSDIPVDAVTHQGYSALRYAAAMSLPDVVDLLLQAGAQPDPSDPSSMSVPLVAAAGAGCLPAVQLLLVAGADVDLCDSNGRSALASAAALGYHEIVKTLIYAGATINPTVPPASKNGAPLIVPLHVAIFGGHVQVIQLLLAEGATCQPLTGSLEAPLPLVWATRYCKIAEIKALLEAKIFDVNACNSSSATALDDALQSRLATSEQVVDLLLQHGANAASENLLVLAAKSDSPAKVKRLVSAGAPVEESGAALAAAVQSLGSASSEIVTLLLGVHSERRISVPLAILQQLFHHSVKSQNVAKAKLLLGAGNLDVLLPIPPTKLPPLQVAVRAGNLAMVKLLCENGANVNELVPVSPKGTSAAVSSSSSSASSSSSPSSSAARDAYASTAGTRQTTALITSIQMKSDQVTAELLAHGANPNLAAAQGISPLMLAAEALSFPLVEMLLRAGADVLARDSHNRTVLMHAARSRAAGEAFAKVDRLIMDAINRAAPDATLAAKIGFDSSSNNKHGVAAHSQLTVLVDAIGSSQHKALDALLKTSTLSVDQHATLLHEAVKRNRVECVRALLDNGISPNARPPGRMGSALLVACEEGFLELVELLLQRGAHANAATDQGWTPLMAAAFQGNYGAVDLLVRHLTPGDLAAINVSGWTALQTAVNQGQLRTAKRLIEAGTSPDCQPSLLAPSPLWLAITNSNVSMIAMLLDCQAKVYRPGFRSLLEHAINSGNLNVIRMIWQANVANPTASDPFMSDALYLAVRRDAASTASLLVELGCNPAKVWPLVRSRRTRYSMMRTLAMLESRSPAPAKRIEA